MRGSRAVRQSLTFRTRATPRSSAWWAFASTGPDQIGPAWDQALSADRPVVVEAISDPNVPPLPPHITLEQAKMFASSIWKGDAEALGFIKQTAKDAAESYLPHRKS